MATSATFYGAWSGNYRLRMTVTAVLDHANNRSTIRARGAIESTNSAYFSISTWLNATITGQTLFDGAMHVTTVANGSVDVFDQVLVVNHNSNGDLSVLCTEAISNGFTSASVAGTLHVDRIASVPGKPSGPPGWSRDGANMRVRSTVAPANGSPVLEYQLRTRNNGGGSWSEYFYLTPDSERLIVQAAQGFGATYEWWSRARSAAGWGPWSDKTTIEWPAPPEPPASVTLTTGPTAVTATWPAAVNNGAPVTRYEVQIFIGGTWGSAYNVSGLTRTFTGLTPGTTYRVRVRARNDMGVSGYRESAPVTLGTAPDPPEVTLARTMQASWAAPDDGGSPVTAYEVQWWDGFAWSDVVSTGARTAQLTDTFAGVGYRARVRARNAVGVSGWTTTPHVTPSKCTCT